ncbi:hypothetical protein DP804_23320 [Salmonella enterica subsp. enterica]|nr:hypothetical protein [Salmonella enterica subsp. enterica serovar Virchow]
MLDKDSPIDFAGYSFDCTLDTKPTLEYRENDVMYYAAADTLFLQDLKTLPSLSDYLKSGVIFGQWHGGDNSFRLHSSSAGVSEELNIDIDNVTVYAVDSFGEKISINIDIGGNKSDIYDWSIKSVVGTN